RRQREGRLPSEPKYPQSPALRWVSNCRALNRLCAWPPPAHLHCTKGRQRLEEFPSIDLNQGALPHLKLSERATMLMRSVDAILSPNLQRGLRLCCNRPRVAELILTVDGWLRRHLGVFEYSERHDYFLRAQVALLRSRVVLSDGTVGDLGERVIHLHFWN